MSLSASSLFVESSCQFQGDTMVSSIVWSEADPVAAMISSTIDENDSEVHQVLFMNDEGILIKNSIITHNYEATILAWQPKARLLAIGWDDGMISCWNVDGKIRPTSTFSNSSAHNSKVTAMAWNSHGRRLVTADGNGLVVVWAVDARGTLTATRQYKKKGEITAIAFCTMSMKVEGPRQSAIEQVYSPSFFFGTSRGGLVYADDLGNCTDVHQLSSALDHMLFFQEPSRLVVITRSLMLIQYDVADDGRVSRSSQVKLSVASDIADKGLREVVWAGAGIIAAACHEKMLRLFDLAADEAYNLSLSQLGQMVDRDEKVTCVAFSTVDRYLAVGTSGGVVAIWRFVGDSRDDAALACLKTGGHAAATSADDWVLHYKTRLRHPCQGLKWTSGQGTLAVMSDNGVLVLNESVLRNASCGDISIFQIDAHEFSVQVASSGMDSWIEKSGMLIHGLSASYSCFVVWSGKKARVYRVDSHLRRAEAMEAFDVSSHSIAIADTTHIAEEALFVADAQIVRVLNFAGIQKSSITFSEAEGNPTHVDIHGSYLVILTDRNVVKVIDVHTPTKPKQMGSAGKFEEPKSVSDDDTEKENEKNHVDTPAIGAMTAAGLGGLGSDFKFFAGLGGFGVQKNSPTAPKNTLSVRSVKINCEGTRVAILADKVEGALQMRHPDSRLFIYDRNRGGVNSYDFSDKSRRPTSVFWDHHDDRLLGVEVVSTGRANNEHGKSDAAELGLGSGSGFNNSSVDSESKNEVEVVVFFATSEHGILLQDSFSRKQPFGPLIGMACPNILFRSAPPPMGEDGLPVRNPLQDLKVCTKVMRDFVGLETEVDEESRLALLEFSYNLTLGKLDEAYKAVKTVDSPSIWENMAQMCVKTRRLDVAEVCLGHMGHARGAAAIREARAEGSSNEACIGILAIQLGLLDDAAALFRETKRFDLLNRLYQAAGLWQKAINIAETKDRIHLKTTHFHYAKHLESVGDVDNALKNFEKSETARHEVPRMLFNMGLMGDLEDYVHRSADKDLLKWWAAYLESKGRYDKARKYYSRANDFLSLVRIACFKGDMATAAEIVSEAGDRAASYHFARQLEVQGEFAQAISYYANAGCYNQAIRLARANNMDGDLMRFALKSTPSLMLDCANHFEQKGDMDKAIQLYHKGGDLARALDLCFRSGENNSGNKKDKDQSQNQAVFDMLNTIAADLGENTSPQTLARCAQFLVEHKQYERAADLYIMAKRVPQAIEMCFNYKVNISEAMLERLDPPEDMDPGERKEALKDLAKALKRQGNFLLASKKYTQAGDRVKAIKCLVRSGDTKAVIQFASISRSPEIYKLAANYLQQMNWRESAEIMKAIITFYTKAKAFEQLAGFYDSCAQVEIDEYRDYEKAYGALREALKQLSRAEDNGSGYIERMAQEMQSRIGLIERFIQARKASKKEPMVMVSICDGLLKESNLEDAIRVGDCLAMLVEYHYSNGNMQDAYNYMKDMESRNIALHPFLDSTIIDDICKAMGVTSAPSSPVKQRGRGHGHGSDIGKYDSKNNDEEVGELEEDIEEDIAEDLDGEEKDQNDQSMPRWGRPYAAPRK